MGYELYVFKISSRSSLNSSYDGNDRARLFENDMHAIVKSKEFGYEEVTKGNCETPKGESFGAQIYFSDND